MNLSLTDEDRRAVDLLLDQGLTAIARPSARPVLAGHHGLTRKRIARMERLLGLLDALPPAEPPRNLVQRTLEFIETPSAARSSHSARVASFNSHGPHA